MMMKLCIQFLVGGIVAIISGILLEQYRKNKVAPWKIFSFLWAAPILLFIPLYISYSKDTKGSVDFLLHALLGSLGTVTIILITLLLINMQFNYIATLVLNFIMSYVIIFLYFKFKIYSKTF